ncbi:poly(ADP-ribose) glycohydrolase isoform X2 [Cololabis saira]|uniref:poly(ADP-ribose) glycohydrolase isoform X2 n=1 Tax=Cololabis saira TaxID=129043 RepID=UPI002AD23CAD|nr:poly(ADP-ribose) glycohydrolase isoform X2 [Cololabis saira]
MARNDSSQMKALIQLDEGEINHNNKPKNENNKPKNEKQQSRSSSSDQACCSSSSVSEPTGNVRRADDGEPAKMQIEEDASSCCQLSDLKRLGDCGIKLGPLKFSQSHTILVDVDVFNAKAGIMPQDGRDMWLSNFVKMPCSPSSTALSSKTDSSSVLPNFLSQAKPTQVPRWKLISNKLNALARQKSVKVDDVVEAILSFNPKYRGKWSFDALTTFVQRIPKEENYFHTLFPKIAALALNLEEQVKKAIPLLRQGHPAAITLSQRQISCLLANAFFCTFPHRNTSTPTAEYHGYPSINFTSLFGGWSERKKEKLRAIMHYFHVMTDDGTIPEGLVTFERRCLGNAEIPNWRSCTETLPKLHVTSCGGIEAEGTGLLQVDFASSWIGGGVLGSGLVQEEILFLMNPELIVSRLFTEKLGDNECLIIKGAQQFSGYSGFSDSFEWAGPYDELLDRDEWGRLRRQVLAIDAKHFKHKREQYNMVSILRELNKAYCGFKRYSRHKDPDIATGKWGCGAFNGDAQLKAVIQLMAAAKAGRGLAFFTFGDDALERGLKQIYHLLVTERTTVDQLYGHLEDFCAQRERSPSMDLFQFIRKTIRRSRSQL